MPGKFLANYRSQLNLTHSLLCWEFCHPGRLKKCDKAKQLKRRKQLRQSGDNWCVCVCVCLSEERGHWRVQGKSIYNGAETPTSQASSPAPPSPHTQELSTCHLHGNKGAFQFIPVSVGFLHQMGRRRFALSHFKNNPIENINELIMHTIKKIYVLAIL